MYWQHILYMFYDNCSIRHNNVLWKGLFSPPPQMFICTRSKIIFVVYYKIFIHVMNIYSEKQLKDSKILSYFLHSRKYISIEICMHVTVLSIHNFSGCKMQSTLHWLQYSTASNVHTLYNKTSHKIQIEFKAFSLSECLGKVLHNHKKVCDNNLLPFVPLLIKV